jgi:hypothetical protein
MKEKITKKVRFKVLIVFSPGVAAFGAPEEPDLALIGGTELAEPPEGLVMLALGTLGRDGGEGPCLLFVFDDDHLLLASLFGLSHLIGGLDLPDIPAFSAFELAGRGDHKAFAFRAEHCFNYAWATKINAWLGQKTGKREHLQGRFIVPHGNSF